MEEIDQLSDMSDSETMYSDSETCVSDTETVVDGLVFPTGIVDNSISTRYIDDSTPYLTRKRYNDHDELKKKDPRAWPLLPPAASIEFSFRDFTSSLGCAFLVALHTPISRTTEGSADEFRSIAKELKVRFDPSVPEYKESSGNELEVKRMLLTSVLKWAERWKEIPDGVSRKLLYSDLIKFIRIAAQEKMIEDREMRIYGIEGMCYGEADWRAVMAADLAASRWAGWR
ncbi:hypothetical protein AAF712_010081 [Marasmius tenuissimus]|uniref:Uncharacterized protein n=1 Tax=Marasmius tenuissimus TaxID=585030 RepID=A0ABR2ZP15_9AGAR